MFSKSLGEEAQAVFMTFIKPLHSTLHCDGSTGVELSWQEYFPSMQEALERTTSTTEV